MMINLSVPVGVSSFPEDGLVLSDLVVAASENLHLSHPTQSDEHDDRGLGATGAANPLQLPQAKDPGASKSSAPTVAAIVRTAISFLRVDQFMKLSIPLSNVANFDIPFYNPEFWVNQLPYQSAQARALYAKLKRATDILLVVLSAIMTLPVGLLIALIILIEDGRPILFVQKRTGYGGKVFKMYKFRSMIPNAEARMQELGVRVNERGETINERGEKLENDPRITRIGRLLRKTSLDELPQLWNVLAGHMSLVGPRPTSFGLNSYTLLQTQRLSVKPGITGLWQIYDRGDTDFNNRLIWDIKYIEKLSLTLDSQIIVRTVLSALKQRGAR
jgi:lipopolysaccharide/colanic/teichoic acid biosynthesis glycosyltransferase